MKPTLDIGARIRMTGSGPTPTGYVPCLTVGDTCSPQWGPFTAGRADHYHPAFAAIPRSNR